MPIARVCRSLGCGLAEEAVRGRDDSQVVSRVAVLLHERDRRHRDHGLDARVDELCPPPAQLIWRVLDEGLELELHGLVDVQSPGHILAVETFAFGADPIPVEHALLGEELVPGAFAVACQQGIVQFVQSERHDHLTIPIPERRGRRPP
jgi:hypothetical protein